MQCPEGDGEVGVRCMGGWHGARPVNELDERGGWEKVLLIVMQMAWLWSCEPLSQAII